MTTLTWFTGFEYGLGNMSANGGGLCDAVLNTCKVSLVGGAFPPAHSVGQYILQCAPSNSVKAFITKNIPGTPNIIVHRFYINFGDTLPVGDIVVYSLTTTGHKVQVSWKSADAKFYIGIDGALTTAGIAAAVSTWYGIDIMADIHANPWLTDWYIDGAAQTQNSYAHAAETFSAAEIGGNTTKIANLFYDDVAFSVTAADFPIGPGGTFGSRPYADGVHNNGAGVLTDGSNHTIDGVTYFAYQQLSENPWLAGSATIVRQNSIDAAKYCEIQFEPVYAQITFLGVEALLQYQASGTTADTGGCIVRDSVPTETEIWGKSGGLKDYSESSQFYKNALVSVPAGGWDKTKIDALRCRIGYSDNVTTKPYWIAIMLEVAFSVPSGVILATDAAIMVESKESADEIRVTNAAIMIEDKEVTDLIQVTNAAIMVEWRPPYTLDTEGTQVI